MHTQTLNKTTVIGSQPTTCWLDLCFCTVYVQKWQSILVPIYLLTCYDPGSLNNVSSNSCCYSNMYQISLAVTITGVLYSKSSTQVQVKNLY